MLFGVPYDQLAILAVGLLGAGAITGVLAGVFGVGGGAVIVPVLYELFGVAGVQLLIDGAHVRVSLDGRGSDGWLDADGICAPWADLTDAPPERADGAAHGLISSRMHGLLVRLAVQAGQHVRQGDFLLAIEAMKMEHRIEAPITGTVVELGAAAGSQVSPGQLLLRIDAKPDQAQP